MENVLLIYLTDRTAEFAHWIEVNDAVIRASPTPCLLQACPPPKNNTTVIVLFPAEEMLLTTTTLPPARRAQQAAAALYALEEKLAEDVLDLHPMIFAELALHTFSVGVIRKALLEDWLEKLKVAGLTPRYLMPDIFAIPWQEGHWTTVFFHQRVLIRTGLSQGFAVQEAHYDLFINKHIHPDILRFQEETLTLFLKTLQTNKTLLRTFNLLQGKYRPATHFQALRKIWQWPLLLGAGWLLVWGGFNTVQYIIGDAQSASLDKQITALYYQAYPAATSVNSPQVRIEQEMSQLKNKQQNHRSLGLIAAAGNILKQMPQTTIESFTLRENALQMHIQTKDFHALEQIVNALQKSGLQVKQSDAARSGDNVTAALSVSTGEKTDDKE